MSNIISFDDAKRRRTGKGTKTLQVSQSTGKVTPKDKEIQQQFEERIYRIQQTLVRINNLLKTLKELHNKSTKGPRNENS